MPACAFGHKRQIFLNVSVNLSVKMSRWFMCGSSGELYHTAGLRRQAFFRVSIPNRFLKCIIVICFSSFNYDSGTLCPDGSCIQEGEKCPQYDGCPLLKPIMCYDGSCRSSLEQCKCPNGEWRCFDGTCKSECMKVNVFFHKLT